MTAKLKSKAFRRGFTQGFGAPVLFFAPTGYPRTDSIDATIFHSWRRVYEALNKAEKVAKVDILLNSTKGNSIGKKSRQADGQRRRLSA